jgi:pimeloyl-ACP methyl ester carboxylesterase
MAIRMLKEDEVDVRAPPLWMLLLEWRALAEYGSLPFRRKMVRSLPRGDGHPVMIVPGFGADDRSTRALQKILADLGYAAEGWGQGRNLGMRRGTKETLAKRLEDLHGASGKKVSLIGWSLGGVFVREMARHAPQHVRRVFTLGSPINGHPSANNVDALFRWVNRSKPMKLDWDGFQRRRIAPPVPCTAIYSRSDGVVAWRCSLEEEAPNTENVEVNSTHFGLAANAQVIRAIAERLARPA